MAAGGGFDPVKQYQAITLSIPPVLTAGALPVVALSLLCKAATGSGLPGPLGLVEGIAWLTVPLGAPHSHARAPRHTAAADANVYTAIAVARNPAIPQAPARCCRAWARS